MKQHPLTRALQRRLPWLILVLFLLQPVMDVLSYWTDYAGMNNTITLLLRLCVLVLIVLTGFWLSRRKWIYYVAVGLLLVLTVCHVLVCRRYGYQDPIGDLTNLVRIYQLPLTTLAFISYLRSDPACMKWVKYGFLGSFALILLVEILATVTGTDPHTYANKGVGVLGWFVTPSAQSAILSMLVPVVVVCVADRKKLHPLWTAGISLVGFGSLYLFATRLAYAALVGSAAALALSCLVIKLVGKVKAGRAALVFGLCAVAAVLLVNLSPMAENNALTSWHAQRKQNEINAMVEADTAAAREAGLSGHELQVAALRSAYEEFVPGVVGRFGLERTAEYYDYSTDASKVADARVQKKAFCAMTMEEQPGCRLFGLELGDLSHGGNTYDAENDFHGIYFLCGGVGLALLVLFLAYFVLRIAAALIRDFKYYFTLPAAGFGVALICALAHAYFTAGLLRRPNANFYLAAILAAVYALTAARRETEDHEVTADE